MGRLLDVDIDHFEEPCCRGGIYQIKQVHDLRFLVHSHLLFGEQVEIMTNMAFNSVALLYLECEDLSTVIHPL